MISEAATIVLLWTAPTLNADSTLCTDLAGGTIHAYREATGDTLHFENPVCKQTDDGPVCYGPGDSLQIEVVLPPSPGEDWYQFTVTHYDSTGNVSEHSNVVRADMGNGGVVVGVEPEPGMAVKEEWFDVHGRRINRPESSGVYFRRRGLVVDKIVRVR